MIYGILGLILSLARLIYLIVEHKRKKTPLNWFSVMFAAFVFFLLGSAAFMCLPYVQRQAWYIRMHARFYGWVMFLYMFFFGFPCWLILGSLLGITTKPNKKPVPLATRVGVKILCVLMGLGTLFALVDFSFFLCHPDGVEMTGVSLSDTTQGEMSDRFSLLYDREGNAYHLVRAGHAWHMRYPLEDEQETVRVYYLPTTRLVMGIARREPVITALDGRDMSHWAQDGWIWVYSFYDEAARYWTIMPILFMLIIVLIFFLPVLLGRMRRGNKFPEANALENAPTNKPQPPRPEDTHTDDQP